MQLLKKFMVVIGAGLCLALTRVVARGFQSDLTEIGGWIVKAILGSFLLAIPLIAVISIFAFLAYPKSNGGKLFMKCLLIPSILFNCLPAATTQTESVDNSTPTAVQEIWDIDADPFGAVFDGLNIFLPSVAYADDSIPDSARILNARLIGSKINTVDPASLEKGAFDIALQMVGRTKPDRSYTYIIGKTTDSSKADSLVKSVKAMTNFADNVKLLRLEADSTIYITLGGQGDLKRSVAIQNYAKNAYEKIKSDSTTIDLKTAESICNGRIVDLKQLGGK
ncbi:MAG: hypothetical protein GY865_13810 [candidate division Zixibacteria bacterium]|nr:hypothetical protein [candidate division Zixibacteria bacterium]